MADKFAELMRLRYQAISKQQAAELQFSDFVLKSAQPVLVKGSSLFFDAVLPRAGQTDYPTTLMVQLITHTQPESLSVEKLPEKIAKYTLYSGSSTKFEIKKKVFATVRFIRSI